MHWPPWKPDPEVLRAREEAERELREAQRRRPKVEAAAEMTRQHMIRNHLVEKAFAMRERGTP